MKIVIRLIASLNAMVLTYLLYSFILWQPNPSFWTFYERYTVVVLMVGVALITQIFFNIGDNLWQKLL